MARFVMIALDTNILVYAQRYEMPQNQVAFDLMNELSEGSEPWAIPWPCCYEFLGVATNRRAWGDTASTMQQAWRQLEAWVASPSCRQIGESAGFMDTLSQVVNRPGLLGSKVHDARIAAICLANGVDVLLTSDRDFAMFPQLVTRNPFVR
ncbi:type II toxin-antitoxin system VapC family toxin [Candidatus Poriferisodalis sp.]|uniref:type II toxin-antitoxin system VapC family toxin n=1 Tax=Candidatus Poriferisodalis sp. TaxID=3101277 RepID=UPI003B016438